MEQSRYRYHHKHYHKSRHRDPDHHNRRHGHQDHGHRRHRDQEVERHYYDRHGDRKYKSYHHDEVRDFVRERDFDKHSEVKASTKKTFKLKRERVTSDDEESEIEERHKPKKIKVKKERPRSSSSSSSASSRSSSSSSKEGRKKKKKKKHTFKLIIKKEKHCKPLDRSKAKKYKKKKKSYSRNSSPSAKEFSSADERFEKLKKKIKEHRKPSPTSSDEIFSGSGVERVKKSKKKQHRKKSNKSKKNDLTQSESEEEDLAHDVKVKSEPFDEVKVKEEPMINEETKSVHNATLDRINRLLKEQRKTERPSQHSKSDDDIQEIIVKPIKSSANTITEPDDDDDIIIVHCEKPKTVNVKSEKPLVKKAQSSEANVLKTKIPSKTVNLLEFKENKDFEFCFVNIATDARNATKVELSFVVNNEDVAFYNDIEEGEDMEDKMKEIFLQIGSAKPVRNLILVIPSVFQMKWMANIDLSTVFHGWLDLSLLVQNSRFTQPTLIKSQENDPEILKKIFNIMFHDDNNVIPSIQSPLLMKQIMEKVLATNQNLQIYNFLELSSKQRQSYLFVLFHVETINSDIKEDFNLVSISYSVNGDEVWLRNIHSNLSEKENSDILHEGNHQSLKTGEALTQFLDSLENLKRDVNYDKIALVTMKNDKSLPILLSHLCEWTLFEKFLALTGAVGSLEDCLAFRKINLNQSNFEAFEKLYFKRFGKDVNFHNNKNVSKYGYEIFQELFSEELSNSDLFTKKFFHPVFSVYVNNLLLKSQILGLREGYYGLYNGEKAYIKSGDSDFVIAYLNTALPREIGKNFYLRQTRGAELGISHYKLTLQRDYSFMLKVENKTLETICLEKGEKLGILSLDENFMIGSETLTSKNEKSPSNLTCSDKVSYFPKDFRAKDKKECDAVGDRNTVPCQTPSSLSLDTEDVHSATVEPHISNNSIDADAYSTSQGQNISISNNQNAKPKVKTKDDPQLHKKSGFGRQKISYSEWKERIKRSKENPTEVKVAANSQLIGRNEDNRVIVSKHYISQSKEQEEKVKAGDNLPRNIFNGKTLTAEAAFDKRVSECKDSENSTNSQQTTIREELCDSNQDQCNSNSLQTTSTLIEHNENYGNSENMSISNQQNQTKNELVSIKEISQDLLGSLDTSPIEDENNEAISKKGHEDETNAEEMAPVDTSVKIRADVCTIDCEENKTESDVESLLMGIDDEDPKNSQQEDLKQDESIGTIGLEPASPGSSGEEELESRNIDRMSCISPETPHLGTINLEPVGKEDNQSDVSLSDSEYEELLENDPYQGFSKAKGSHNGNRPLGEDRSKADGEEGKTIEIPKKLDTISPSNNVENELKLVEFLKESSRKNKYGVQLKLYTEGSKVSVKLRKCRVELVRLTDKELKLYKPRQKVAKKREVWIENKEKCLVQGSSLRVAIKESLKMKNEAPNKMNDFQPVLQNIGKKSISEEKQPATEEERKKPGRVMISPSPPAKVKTLIDPQSSLVQQMKNIHEKLPEVEKQTLTDLSNVIPAIRTVSGLADLLWTFVRQG